MPATSSLQAPNYAIRFLRRACPPWCWRRTRRSTPVEAPEDLRLARGLERDGALLEDQWRRWMRDEAEHFAHDDTSARADLVVDGTGQREPLSRWDI